MIKKNLKTVIITSVITILPIFAGLIMWNKLPEKMPTHWGFSGEVDGWSDKPFAIFFIPLFMLAIHLVCAVATSIDPKNQGVNSKVFTLVLWICPVLSVVCMAHRKQLNYLSGRTLDGRLKESYGLLRWH